MNPNIAEAEAEAEVEVDTGRSLWFETSLIYIVSARTTRDA